MFPYILLILKTFLFHMATHSTEMHLPLNSLPLWPPPLFPLFFLGVRQSLAIQYCLHFFPSCAQGCAKNNSLLLASSQLCTCLPWFCALQSMTLIYIMCFFQYCCLQLLFINIVCIRVLPVLTSNNLLKEPHWVIILPHHNGIQIASQIHIQHGVIGLELVIQRLLDFIC
jgi:hypothetical protein